jgi:hypothetical protein
MLFQLPCYPNVDLPYTGPLMRHARVHRQHVLLSRRHHLAHRLNSLYYPKDYNDRHRLGARNHLVRQRLRLLVGVPDADVCATQKLQ